MVMLTIAPLVMVPTAQVTSAPLFVGLPCVELADTKVKPAGSASVTVTLEAVNGPRLVRFSVKKTGLPTFTTGADTDLPRARSLSGVLQHWLTLILMESMNQPVSLEPSSVPSR